MTIGYRFADRGIGLGPAVAPPNILAGVQAVPWAPSITWAALALCTNNGYLFKTTAGGAGNTSGDGPSQSNLVDASCTWVAVGPLNGLYAADTVATVPVNTKVTGISPDFGEGEFVYVKFSGTTAAGDSVVYDTYAGTAVVNPTTPIQGLLGISMAIQASGQYGWIMIRGVHGAASVINGAAAGPLGSSVTTAGRFIAAVTTSTALNKVLGAFLRLAPVGSLNFGLVEVRYPEHIKTT